MDNQDWQRASKAHMAYSAEKPEWMQFALKAMNKWGKGDFTITHIVALAIEDAYRMGKEGIPVDAWVAPSRPENGGLYDFASHLKKKAPPPIEAPPEPVQVLRRSRPAPVEEEPEEAAPVVRRRSRGSPELQAAFETLLPTPVIRRRR